jgi:hypothetical protein
MAEADDIKLCPRQEHYKTSSSIHLWPKGHRDILPRGGVDSQFSTLLPHHHGRSHSTSFPTEVCYDQLHPHLNPLRKSKCRGGKEKKLETRKAE